MLLTLAYLFDVVYVERFGCGTFVLTQFRRQNETWNSPVMEQLRDEEEVNDVPSSVASTNKIESVTFGTTCSKPTGGEQRVVNRGFNN